MYTIVNTFKKLNDADVCIIPTSINYFTEQEQIILNDFMGITLNSPGISNFTFNYVTMNERTITFEVDTLANLNAYDIAVSNHPFTIIRNRKLREYNIPQYLVIRNITEI